MKQIKKIGIFSLARILAIVNLLTGILISLYLMVSSTLHPYASLYRLLILLGVPFIYAVMGFLSGLFLGLVYNIVSPIIGGLEIETE